LRLDAGAPEFQALRYDEDYRYLLDPAQRSESLDRIKFISLPGAGQSYLSLGGEARIRYEYFRHALWGQGPQDDNGYVLQRYMLHADWRVDDHVRLFAQLKSGYEGGRNGGPRATDEDRGDINQAFVDGRFELDAGRSITTRVGRQEMAFGSSRLISFRESPNVRLAFDGVREIVRLGAQRIDAFAVQPARTNPGAFDDGSDGTQKLWGLYSVTPLPLLPGGHLDLYYLGLVRDVARFAQGSAREKRHSVGARIWGTHAAWDYNFEFVYQFGDFGAGAIAAWTVASDTGRTFTDLPLRPRFGVKADVASGDRDPDRATLGTFNALFPRGAYFNESGLIGPANVIDLHPSLTLQVIRTVTVSLDVDFLWRESTRDGLYGPAVNLVRAGKLSSARKIGTQPSIGAEWRPGRHWKVAATVARFNAGEFIRESGSGENVDYASTWLTWTF
jgi:hypothetical protein